MFSAATRLVVTAEQKRELELLIRNGNSPQKVALRCKVVLLAHEGVANSRIADQLKVSRPTVLALRAAFAEDGINAVKGPRRRKRSPKVLTAELEQRILDTTLKTRPGDGSTHWSVRRLAAHLRVSRTIVHRVWQRHDVQPHRVERFKLSNDPQFEAKVRDIVGLYLNPPDRALLLCVDEKSQIQALDRTAPILPLRPGFPERQTHDYRRHGTTTLFAAFNILNGKVIGSCQHKSAEVQRWLKPKRRKRFHFHFTPTSSSWLNQVERLFALITERMIRRATFHSTSELEQAIYKWLAKWNGSPTPFVWKASADVILGKVQRCKE